MNISPVNMSPATKPSQSDGSKENIQQLEQQKQVLTKELEKVKSDDKIKPQEKEKKIEALQEKLKQIQIQIQKLNQDTERTSQMTSKNDVQRPKTDVFTRGKAPTSAGIYNAKRDEDGSLEIIFDIVNRSESIKQMEVTQTVKKRVDGQVSILKSQAKTDQGVTKESKLEQISELEDLSSNISSLISEKLNSLNEDIDKNTNMDIVPKNEEEPSEKDADDVRRDE